MDSIEQKIYDALYSMRLAPRHQLEQAAKEVAKLFAAPPAPVTREPDGYAYEYPYAFGCGTVISHNNGKEVNGHRPLRSIPYWYGTPPAPAPDRMREAEYNLRIQAFQIGRKLEGYVIEEDEIVALGNELMAISEVCRNCYGEGMDGDPPDANGEGGAIYPCESCDGSGFRKAAPPAPAAASMQDLDDFLSRVQARVIELGHMPPAWPTNERDGTDDPVESAARMICGLLDAAAPTAPAVPDGWLKLWDKVLQNYERSEDDDWCVLTLQAREVKDLLAAAPEPEREEEA